MTIEQTVEIPEFPAGSPLVLKFMNGQKPFIELNLPRALPAGKAKVEVIVTPAAGEWGRTLTDVEKTERRAESSFMQRHWADGALENAIDERDKKKHEEYRRTKKPVTPLMDLFGSCKGDDTLEAYFERKQADKAHETETEFRSGEGKKAL
jgi:hypothetical protein